MAQASTERLASILWHRLDHPGHEWAQVRERPSRKDLQGVAVFLHGQQPCQLAYAIVCDAHWRTRSARVSGWVGSRAIDVELRADGAGRWRQNGRRCPQVEGCLDVDLNFSPSTNLLPIRRLKPRISEKAEVQVAWLRFPSFVLEPLAQTYARRTRDIYDYVSGDGSFKAELIFNSVGFPTSYPPGWKQSSPPKRAAN